MLDCLLRLSYLSPVLACLIVVRGWTATSRTHQSIAIRKSIFQRIIFPEIDGYDEIHSIKTSSVHQNMRRKPRKVIHIQKMHNGKIEDRTTKIENDARRKEVIIRKIGQPIMNGEHIEASAIARRLRKRSFSCEKQSAQSGEHL